MIRRQGDLEFVAQPFGTTVAAMLAAVSMSQIVAVEVMLFFPIVSFEGIRFRWIAQVRHGQFDGRLQSAQVHLHVTRRQIQLRLQRLTVLAHRVLDQIAANVSVDLKQILQAPSNLRISQAGETKIPLIRVRIYAVKLFLHLRNKTGSIDETWVGSIPRAACPRVGGFSTLPANAWHSPTENPSTLEN